VVDGIIGLEDRLRRDASEEEAVDLWLRKDEQDHREAVQTIAGILDRIDGAR